MSWKNHLARVDTLIKEGIGALFDRGRLLVKINEDPKFHEEAFETTGVKPKELLDNKAFDTCFFNFTELRRTLELFPRKEQWISGNIQQMRQQAITQSVKSDSPTNNGGKPNGNGKSPTPSPAKNKVGETNGKPTPHQRNVISRLMYDKVLEENKKLREKNRNLQKQNQELRDRVNHLESLFSKKLLEV